MIIKFTEKDFAEPPWEWKFFQGRFHRLVDAYVESYREGNASFEGVLGAITNMVDGIPSWMWEADNDDRLTFLGNVLYRITKGPQPSKTRRGRPSGEPDEVKKWARDLYFYFRRKGHSSSRVSVGNKTSAQDEAAMVLTRMGILSTANTVERIVFPKKARIPAPKKPIRRFKKRS